MRRRSFVHSSAGLLTLTAGCIGGGSEEPDESSRDIAEEESVEITDASFDPLVVNIAVGGSVTWKNTGDQPYTIDAYQYHTGSTAWNFSETVDPGQSVSHTFDEEGRYDYTDFAQGEYSTCGRVRVGDVSEGESLPCE